MNSDGRRGEATAAGVELAEEHYIGSAAGSQAGTTVHDPRKYFPIVEGHREFQADTLARDIEAVGPLAAGADGLFWTYVGGAWRLSGDNAARTRATRLLGDLYRRNHAMNAEDIIRARAPKIRCDPVPQYINFRNGLYDWRADKLEDHSPKVLSTAQLAVKWWPTATCPAFDKFLSEVLPADAIELAWELIGYLMYSGNDLHTAVMLVGKGRNGKGTFLRVMNALLGSENVTAVSLHSLASNRFAKAQLFGKLANIAGDIDGGYLELTADFKAITGVDSISAEHKGRDAFDFTAWAVPVFSANKIPASSDTSPGFMSRWLVVPFPNSFGGKEDRTLDARLTTPDELAGIAAKAIPALRRLMARGNFELSQSTRDAKAKFVRDVDQVASWIEDHAVLDSSLPHVDRSTLYEAYKHWAYESGHKPVKAGEFYERLEEAGAIPAKVKGVRGFKGIMLGQRDNDGSEGAQRGQGGSSTLTPTCVRGGEYGGAAPSAPSAPQQDSEGEASPTRASRSPSALPSFPATSPTEKARRDWGICRDCNRRVYDPDGHCSGVAA